MTHGPGANALLPFRDIHELILAGKAAEAEAKAREWLAAGQADPKVAGNVGSVFIDVGHDSNRIDLIEEGITLTRGALARAPITAFKFNLANALSSVGRESPEDMVRVAFDPRLAECVSLYYESIDESPEKPEARFNLVSALAKAGRAVEAADLARETLALHRDHGPGWASLGDALWSVWALFGQPSELLHDARDAYRNALEFEGNDRPFRRHVTELIARVDALLAEAPRPAHSHGPEPAAPSRLLVATAPAWGTGLPGFIASLDLGLNLCSACRAQQTTGYDRFPLDGVLTSPGGGDETKLRLAEVDVLMEGFAGARGLLWLSRAEAARDVEVTSWPVAGLTFSRRTAFLAASFREAYGVLDRVAAVLARRFGIEGKMSFDKIFFEKRDRTLVFRSSVAWPESVGLRALLYLSAAFETSNGRFKGLRDLRNSLQHLPVFAGSLDPSATAPWLSVPVDELEAKAISMLRLARAAILYCCEGLRVLEVQALRDATSRGAEILHHDEGAINRE